MVVVQVIRFVERGDRDDLVTGILVILGGKVYDFCPMGGVGSVLVRVISAHERRVTINHEFDIGFDPFEHVDAHLQCVDCPLLHFSVHDGQVRLEGCAYHVKVVLAHEGGTASQVVFIKPCNVCPPFYIFMGDALVRKPEGYDAVCRGLGLQVAA